MSPEGHDPSASGSMVEPDPMLGQVLDGRYRVLQKLGEGGMGEVYAAEHVHIEKRVAVKLLRAEIVTNKEAVSRFRQEARSASSIGHKNIISIEDFGTIDDGRIYLCMELLQGAPFNDLIKEQLSVDRLLNILIQTGHGLAAAHAKDIIHRDMKPENIFVTNGDVPKLLDFGIAKVSGADGQNHLTRTGTIFGTPFYMAPEQALGQAVDHRADIYAMGVIMYEVFTGSIPFMGESFMGILTQHITAEPKPVNTMAAEHGRSVPPGIEEIIVKAMKKDPDERYQTMDELVNVLIAAYRGAVGSGMSSYMEAHVPSSAMMATVAAPVGALSSSMPAAVPGSPGSHTPFPVGPGGHPVPGPGRQGTGPGPHGTGPGPQGPGPGPGPRGTGPGPGYANAAVRHPSSAHPASGQRHPAPGYHSPASSVYDIPKKSKAPLIVAILIILVMSGGAVAFFVLGNKDKKAGTGDEDVDASTVAMGTLDAGSIETPLDAGSVVGATLDAAVVASAKDAAPKISLDAAVVRPKKFVKVKITSSPSRATVRLGSKRIGTTPVTVKHELGTRAVTYSLSKSGYRSGSVKIDGNKKSVSDRLRKKQVVSGDDDDDDDDVTPPDPCKKNAKSAACICKKKPGSVDCKCARNPKLPVCELQ